MDQNNILSNGTGSTVSARFDQDACPIRIKQALMLDDAPRAAPPTILLPANSHEAAAFILRLNESKTPFGIVALRSNVVGCFANIPKTILSTEKLNRIVEFDEISQTVEVEAGVNGGDLEKWLNLKGYTLGQFPQSLHISTIGGWINTRATGSSSAKFGGVENAIKGAEIITPDGAIRQFGPRARPMGGVDALSLFIGSEGSLGVVTKLWLEVHRIQPELTACFVFEDLSAIIEAQRQLVQGGYPLSLLRGYNSTETKHIIPNASEGDCLLIVATSGPKGLVEAQYEAILLQLEAIGGRRLADDSATAWFESRYKVKTMMTERNATEGHVFDTIEVSISWAAAAQCSQEVEEYLREHTAKYHLHFSHSYSTGICLYCLIWLENINDTSVIAALTETWRDVMKIVQSYNGMPGHHHGIGAVRSSVYTSSDDGKIHDMIKTVIDPNNVLHARLLDPSPL